MEGTLKFVVAAFLILSSALLAHAKETERILKAKSPKGSKSPKKSKSKSAEPTSAPTAPIDTSTVINTAADICNSNTATLGPGEFSLGADIDCATSDINLAPGTTLNCKGRTISGLSGAINTNVAISVGAFNSADSAELKNCVIDGTGLTGAVSCVALFGNSSIKGSTVRNCSVGGYGVTTYGGYLTFLGTKNTVEDVILDNSDTTQDLLLLSDEYQLDNVKKTTV